VLTTPGETVDRPRGCLWVVVVASHLDRVLAPRPGHEDELAGSRDLLMETAGNTVTETVPPAHSHADVR
jgi:hypothetical protein